MKIKTLYSKLHGAICTESRLDYIGSVTIDQNWMDEAGLKNGQVVDVLNIDNGSRITTYTIPGKRDSGQICLNGAAAHHFEPGHKVIIIAYAYCELTFEEHQDFQPKVLLFNECPPFKINHEQKKLQWLKEIPTYSLLKEETPSTTQDSLAASSDYLQKFSKGRKGEREKGS